MLFPGVVGKLGPPFPQTAEPIPQRPLPEGIKLVDGNDYDWGDHVIERMQQRGIGIFEVLATLKDYDYIVGSKLNDDCDQYIRGDVKVILNRITHKIVTVVSVNDDNHQRTPLIPAGVPMNIASAINPETKSMLEKMAHPTATPTETAPPAEKGRLFVKTGLAEFVEQYVRSLPPGTFFGARDIYDRMPAEMKVAQASPKSGIGSIASNLSPGSRIARKGLVVKAAGRPGYQKPFLVDTSIPEQTEKRAKTQDLIDQAEALVDKLEADDKAPESAVEPIKPSAIEMYYGDDTANRRAVYGRLHEVVGMLIDLGWAYEFSQNNKTFTLQGEWPPK